jgi:hypothetical protein
MCGVLLILAVPQMFAAVTMQLDLDANGTTCTVQVDGGVAAFSAGTCGNLDLAYSGGDHGALAVSTKPGLLFGGISFVDVAAGHDFVSAPLLQNVNDTQSTSASATGTFTTTFTDTFLTPTPTAFDVTTTFNNLVGGASSADYYALNLNTNTIPASALISSQVGVSGKSANTTVLNAPNPSPGAPYSLTTQIVIHFATKDRLVNASQQIAAVAFVPEPASTLLLGTMLLLTGVGLKKKLTRS